jgi:cell division protein ZapA
MAEEPRSRQDSKQAGRQDANPGEYVTVEIYDQLYHLSGQDPEHIRELAACVEAKMRAVAAHGKTADSLRVAVLAALNLADELSQATSADPRQGHARAASLRMMLDEVLEDEKQGNREQATGNR